LVPGIIPLHATGVLGDDNAIGIVLDIVADVRGQCRLGIEVVDGDREEACFFYET